MNVVRIRSRRYSAVTNMVLTTRMAISPAKMPTRLGSMVVPPGPATAGAMSPDPVTVKCRPFGELLKPRGLRRHPVRVVSAGLADPAPLESSPSMLSPVHSPPGAPPSRVTLSNVAVAWLGSPIVLAPPIRWVVTSYSGEATNRPASTVDGSPASCAVPTWVQFAPSVDS